MSVPHPDIDWDDVVDVICVGTGPGVLGYAICCAAADLDVLLVEPPGRPDAGTAELIAAMTQDLEAPPDESADFYLDAAGPVKIRTAGRRAVAPFVGEHLRQWASLCLASGSGVMFTQVPDVLAPVRDGDGQAITAAVLGPYRPPLDGWLCEQAAEYRLTAQDSFAGMVFDAGRIAGVELADGARIGATGGLAFPVGTGVPDWPRDEHDAEVALVGRRAGRFARLELLRR